jgi:pre-mRNA-processing factor 19
LATQRKNRKISETLAKREELQALKSIISLTPHRASTPGITCVALSPENLSQDTITSVLTGGMDCTVLLLDMKTQRKEATLSGHHKKITQVMFHPHYGVSGTSSGRDVVLSSSQDGTLRVWRGAGETWKCVHVLNVHQGRSVPAFDIHVFGEHVLSVGEDATWAFTDLNTAQTLLSVPNVLSSDGSTRAPFTSCQIHPDGVILGTTTTDHLIRIWDLRSQKNVATFEGHEGEVVDLSFNENGYYLATVARDEVLKLWDLRAPKLINSITLGTPPQTLEYDYSGRYLAVAMGNELRIFADKTLDHVFTIDEHTAEVTDVKWGRDAKWLVTTSMDRQIKVFTVNPAS